MIEKLNPHYSMTTPASIHDEEALTALELTGRIGAKVNELVTNFNKLESETEEAIHNHEAIVQEDLKHQRDYNELTRSETVPTEVEQTFARNIADGTFDGMIDEYAGELSARIDNLFNHFGEGSTTLDAEVLDIRVGSGGRVFESAGTAVRTQLAEISNIAYQQHLNNGVYEYKPTWDFVGNAFKSKPFDIPRGGLSARDDATHYYIDGVDCIVAPRIKIGHIISGEFVVDDTLTLEHCHTGFTRLTHYIPYIEGAQVQVEVTAIGDGKPMLTADNYNNHMDAPNHVKIYCGSVSGNLPEGSTRPVNIRPVTGEDEYNLEWGITGLAYKYQCIALPISCGDVQRVSCSANYWVGGKLYKYNAGTNTHEFVKTLAYHYNSPCWGYECVLDFSDYDSTYYAIILIGKVPGYRDYNSLNNPSGNAVGTRDAQLIGMDISNALTSIHIERRSDARAIVGGRYVTDRNIEFLKSQHHKTVTALIPRQTSAYHYLFGMDDFSGIFYGGGYQTGLFFYNVSPATYYTALLNPNSCAYGETINAHKYGTVCSPFAVMVNGLTYPRSTFDMRYNIANKEYTIERINLEEDIDRLAKYDMLTLGAGHTGHTITVTGLHNDPLTISAVESVTPVTGHHIYQMHEGSPFFKTSPTGYVNKFTYLNKVNKGCGAFIGDMAEWTPQYTEPQTVMCNRGYGAVYTHETPVLLSVSLDVNRIDIYINEVLTHSRNVDDFDALDLNGYRVIDITALVGSGRIRIRDDISDRYEEFHVIDASPYVFEASLDGDMLTIRTDRTSEVKYVNVILDAENGDYVGTGGASMIFEPNFVNGEMQINTLINTDDIGIWSLKKRDNWRDSVNVVYKTDFDTNTFCVDAEGNSLA